MTLLRTYNHMGKSLELVELESTPAGSSEVIGPLAPGAGVITISDIQLSSPELSPGDRFRLTARIEGSNIAFIFFEFLLYDPALKKAYGPVLRNFIKASRNRVTGGVKYPLWQAPLEIQVKARPRLRLLDDGHAAAFCFLAPASYGALPWNALYALDGSYSFVADGSQLNATAYFGSNHKLEKIIGFSGRGPAYSPRTLIPQAGDQFTPHGCLLTRPVAEGEAWGEGLCRSSSLTFGGGKMRWIETPLIPGQYLAGFVVQDMDGQMHRRYAELSVKRS
jgi:hypothetical protein